MIISASRRTDIPALYARWLINRVRAGFCLVPNPFNPRQISRVDLTPAQVDVIVFWTRNPQPLQPHLRELDARGYRYYFQYTLLGYPRAIEPYSPPLEAAVENFHRLAAEIGAEKVIWRYDPILLTPLTDVVYHQEMYQQIAELLRGATRRSVISFVSAYPKLASRLRALAEKGYVLGEEQFAHQAHRLVSFIVDTARQNDMQVFSCAEQHDLKLDGLLPGKCIDDTYIANVFGIRVGNRKDPSQRPACGCVVSKDIGMYDTCSFGCQYCYAVSSVSAAQKRHKMHDPDAPILIPG
ncbi:MAG: DUF1848 domain-containing protein [Anaerolineae bacterium]|nr:DUF1848 domain-containing protein [Anaerolineae bacterium]